MKKNKIKKNLYIIVKQCEKKVDVLFKFLNLNECKKKLVDMRDIYFENDGSLYYGHKTCAIEFLKERIKEYVSANNRFKGVQLYPKEEIINLRKLLNKIKRTKITIDQQVRIFQDFSFELHNKSITRFYWCNIAYRIIKKEVYYNLNGGGYYGNIIRGKRRNSRTFR